MVGQRQHHNTHHGQRQHGYPSRADASLKPWSGCATSTRKKRKTKRKETEDIGGKAQASWNAQDKQFHCTACGAGGACAGECLHERPPLVACPCGASHLVPATPAACGLGLRAHARGGQDNSSEAARLSNQEGRCGKAWVYQRVCGMLELV